MGKGGSMSEGDYELYALHFNGRVPAIRYYQSRTKGIKARKKYRAMGYHVQLNKVEIPDAGEKGVGGDNNLSRTRFADWFRPSRVAAKFARGRNR